MMPTGNMIFAMNRHLRHCFDVPDTWKGKQISIVFEGVMTDAEVKINDVIAGPVHQGSSIVFLMISRTGLEIRETI